VFRDRPGVMDLGTGSKATNRKRRSYSILRIPQAGGRGDDALRPLPVHLKDSFIARLEAFHWRSGL
jgi:hypothetical protein